MSFFVLFQKIVNVLVLSDMSFKIVWENELLCGNIFAIESYLSIFQLY